MLPTILKRPINPSDHPDTAGDSPHTAITPGIWVAMKAT
tara:strand:+ start:302 stop:418 length:117 start_codon:yes stop_codon:yes gene_type:complete